jgi:hypothetical protein
MPYGSEWYIEVAYLICFLMVRYLLSVEEPVDLSLLCLVVRSADVLSMTSYLPLV